MKITASLPWLTVLALGVGIGAAGCANSDGAAAVPVSGTVTYQQKPVAKGSVQFVPDVGRGAFGVIEDGKFTLSTYGNNDGAIPGKHKVAVISSEPDTKKRKDGDTSDKYLIPQRFASPESSGIKVGIRQTAEPYEFYAEQDLAAGTEWKPFSFEFSAGSFVVWMAA